MLTRSNGIANQVVNAKDKTNKKESEEEVKLEVAGSLETDGRYNLDLAKNNIENNLKATVKKFDESLDVEYNGYNYIVYNNGKVIQVERILDIKNQKYATSNTTVEDIYGNIFILPEGFKVVVNDDTNNAETVNKGIVIEDEKENQFVWVPLGTFNINEARTEKENIELGRYDFSSNGTPSKFLSTEYTEDTKENHNSSYGNAIADDIDTFINKANSNNGYYIARYEAGVINYDSSKTLTNNSNKEENWTGYIAQSGKSLELVSRKGQKVWNYITQNKASELAKSMYVDRTYKSDLINSYVWDTTMVFIQKCSGDEDYSRQNRLQSTLAKTGEATNGLSKDVRCNIYDMAGNLLEWSTESRHNITNPCVDRGADYYYSVNYAGKRSFYSTTGADFLVSFRMILYL